MSNYIVENRALLEAVTTTAKRLGVNCKTFSGDWIIRLEKDGKKRFIFGYYFDFISEASSTIAKDKVATFDLLNENKLVAVPHYLLSTVLNRRIDSSNLEELLKKHERLVVKPLRGSRGELVGCFSDVNHILEFTNHTSEISWTASPYIDVKSEIRLIIFNGVICLGYTKHTPVTVNGLRMYNLNLGTKAERLKVAEIPESVQDLAKKSMDAIGLKMGAVDIIFDQKGVAHVLEINSGFSLEHFALHSTENREEVIKFYELITESLFIN